MKIQYMSDLHMEFQENSRYLKNNELPVTGDVLVLAGDIFYLKDKTAPVMNFWKWAFKNYCQVLIVPGNHEYYNFSDVMERGFQWKWMLRKTYHQEHSIYYIKYTITFAHNFSFHLMFLPISDWYRQPYPLFCLQPAIISEIPLTGIYQLLSNSYTAFRSDRYDKHTLR